MKYKLTFQQDVYIEIDEKVHPISKHVQLIKDEVLNELNNYFSSYGADLNWCKQAITFIDLKRHNFKREKLFD